MGRRAGQGQEGVVEGRAPQGDLIHRHPDRDHRVGDVAEVDRFPRRRDRDGPPLRRQGHPEPRVEAGHQPVEAAHVARHHVDPLVADLGPQLGRTAHGHQHPVVDEDDVVGQLVGLLQVLGGQQQGHSLGHQLPDRRPHHLAAAGVEPGRRLVEHQQLRLGHQAGRQVDPPALAARDRLDQLVPELADVETLDQVVGHRRRLAPPVAAQAGHQHQVLPGREVGLERGELPGQRDGLAHRVGLMDDVVAAHLGGAAGGLRQRGQHSHDGRLAGAVRPQQGHHHASGHG